ncbi:MULTISPECIES: hypothetical protein [unclassified Pseudomonas]|uniref:hypothetical protein n=1 Tax=unclassified Pseudomonas TaxID=196821 RepID=UPI0028D1558D|nr:hypothetical protein [uncultured Pseudomonas sp.]
MDIDENAPGNVSQKVRAGITDNETGVDQKTKDTATPVTSKDDAHLEEDMSDVEAADSVTSEHPEK